MIRSASAQKQVLHLRHKRIRSESEFGGICEQFAAKCQAVFLVLWTLRMFVIVGIMGILMNTVINQVAYRNNSWSLVFALIVSTHLPTRLRLDSCLRALESWPSLGGQQAFRSYFCW